MKKETERQRLGYTPPSIRTVQFQIENGYIDSVAISERLIDGRSYDNSDFGPSHSGGFENLGDGNSYGDNHFSDDITQ